MAPYQSTVSELKDYIQVQPKDLGLSDTADGDGDGTSDWEEFLAQLQDKAKSRIDSYCQRDFEHHQDEKVTLSGKRGHSKVLRLPHPVLSVSSITIEGNTVDSDSYEWQQGGSLIKTGPDPELGRTHIKSGYGNLPSVGTTRGKHTWPSGYNNIEVTLDYGYQSPPEDVVEAEMKLVDHTLVGMAQKREAPIVQTDDFSVTANIPVAMNKEIKEMLRPYRSSGVGN